jgi:Rhamnan synthesis protein F/Methyltransferase domain
MKRLLCYAHFDERGEVKEFVRHALDAMKSVCSTQIFVSNSPIPDSDRVLLEQTCMHVVAKENVGYDFHMWQQGLGLADFADYDEIVLMNSSIYGPILPIEDVFREMEKRRCDFWGITECFQMRPHVQSYFLVFRKQVIISPEFAAFWRGVLPYVNKNQIVMSYEVGLTQWLVDSGFQLSVYSNVYKLAAVAQRIGKRVKLKDNQTIKHPRESLQIGNPFLKREVVRTNPAAVRSLMETLHEHHYPESYFQESSQEGATICPVCAKRGRQYYRKIRDRVNVYNAGRYTYYKCGNSACGILWTSQSGQLATDLVATHDYSMDGCSALGELSTMKRSVTTELLLGMLNTVAGWLGIPKARAGFVLLELDRLTPGKLLAIGCNDAGRLAKLSSLGWEITALDAGGLTTAGGGLEGRFDIVFLPDIIAQRSDVREFLSACNETLKPGGRIYLSTPNARALTHSLFRKCWFGIEPSRHVSVFTPDAVEKLLLDARFTGIKVKTVSCQTETYLLHSIDILLNKWTYLASGPRLGKEVLPLLLQLIFWFVNGISGRRGDECLAIASK